MIDDFRAETQLRLNESLIFKTLKAKSEKDPSGSKVMSLIDEAVFYSYQRTKTIIRHMGEFTLHDGEHLFRVLHLMERLLTRDQIKELSVPELMLLILSAFFHDIGMAPSEVEIINWKKVWDSSQSFSDEDEEKTFKTFRRFCNSKPDKLSEINALILQGKSTEVDLLKSYLISEFIRITHSQRALDIIEKDWLGKIIYRDKDLTVEFAQICYSHNEDALTLLDLDKNCLCGPNVYACLPFVGVILRLADILDFDGKRTPSILFSHLYVKHPVSLAEWGKHRSIEAWEISPDIIQFNAKCSHPAIEATIHHFCDIIDRELSTCNNVITVLNDFFKIKSRKLSLKIPFTVSRDKIETKKDIHGSPLYIYRETQFNLSKKQVIDLLMGTKLYGNPEVALRELLQNSIDACLLRQALEKKWGNHYEPEITVKYYTENSEEILEVIDNGTGMDQYIIDNYYSKIGSSFYKSNDFYDLKSESNADFTPTSRFGIGILSTFMVADTVTVDTRRVYKPHSSSPALTIVIEGEESIFLIKNGLREMPGTSTKLVLRKNNNPWGNMDEDEFIKSVEKTVPNPPFKIIIQTISSRKILNENSFEEINASSLYDYSWNEHDNIVFFEIPLNFKEEGIVGSTVIALLEAHGLPISAIDLTSKSIKIEGNDYSLAKKIRLGENKIIQDSTTITINDDEDIAEEDNTQYFATSKSKLSLHGIEFPTTLFPDSWNISHNQVRISWPFPLVIVIDVCGNRDLDLNSSRTQIIMSEKWVNFEEDLAYLICLGIADAVTKRYWNTLKKVLKTKTKNAQFLNALEKVKK